MLQETRRIGISQRLREFDKARVVHRNGAQAAEVAEKIARDPEVSRHDYLEVTLFTLLDRGDNFVANRRDL